MNDFSKVERSLSISNTPEGVWKIEKKRKARDKKYKSQKNPNNEKPDIEEEGSFMVNIEIDDTNDKECEDLIGYSMLKKKKPLCSKIDLKI